MTAVRTIVEARLLVGVSTAVVAERLGVSPAAVRSFELRVERGQASLARLCAYAEAFGFDVRVQFECRPSVVLAARREELLDLLRRQGVTEAYVFGSVARGEDTPDSDLDLLVRPRPSGVRGVLYLAKEAEELLSCEVDLHVLDDDVPPLVRAEMRPL